VDIHTDGACSGNPGPGGWGAVLRYGTRVKEICGGDPSPTTNNRMELMAAIQALEHLTRPVPVRLHTDSSYLRDGITKWLHGWRRNGWQTAERQPVKNVDLWQRLEAAAKRHQIEWIWVKGHAGDPGNERADALANRGILDAIARGGPPATGDPPVVQPAVDPRHAAYTTSSAKQCWECRSARTKPPDRVAITSGGVVFHLDEQCEALHDG